MSGSLDNILKEVVNRLRAEFSPVAIYLFGSHAYGTPRNLAIRVGATAG